MPEPLFTGVCTALVTPFWDSAINYEMLDKLLHRQIKEGIEAIALCGTTGEAPTLSDREKLQMIRNSKKLVGNACKIIAGTGSNSTAHTVALSVQAQQAAADALLVVSPYYNKANDEGLISHYFAIADAVDLPIIIYNVPSRTGLDIPIHVYQQLSQHPNICGVKEASADITKIGKIVKYCPNLTVWSGNDDQVLAAIALGAKGVISVASNVKPASTKNIVESALQGDYETAKNQYYDLHKLIEFLFCEVNPIPLKAAMRLIGFDCGDCRLPLGPLNKENLLRLKKLLQ